MSLSDGSGFGKNIIISSWCRNDELICAYILNEFLTAEKDYSLNFTYQQQKLWLSLLYNEMSSYIFVNGAETYKFKAKDSKIYPGLLCLGNVSKNFEGSCDTIDDPYARLCGLDEVKNMIVKVFIIVIWL